MDIEYRFPQEFNWIGQTELWPVRDENWSRSKKDLFAKYKNWSQALAYQLYAIYHVDGMESDDYINYAMIGLLESIERFDPRFGISFKFFAKKRIKGGILNNIVKFSEKAQSTQTLQAL
jgi:RNA polymerase sigma factor FliA